MDELRKMLASPAFWLVTVGLTLLLNIAAAYLKRHVDRLGAVLSRRWAARSDESRARRDARIAEFARDPQARTEAVIRTIRLRIDAHFYMGVAMVISLFNGLGWIYLERRLPMPLRWLAVVVVILCAVNWTFRMWDARSLDNDLDGAAKRTP